MKKTIDKVIERNPMASKELSVIATTVVSECVKFGVKYNVKPSEAYETVADVMTRGMKDKGFMSAIDFGMVLYAMSGEEVWDKAEKSAMAHFLDNDN